ncbi:MAG: TRAP transporter large permease [Burkholderiaceae bacterium]|nr:TRAP transporter large permease [Burkholderiaceae bacterium]
MSSLQVGLAALAALLVLIALRVPIFVAIAAVAFCGIASIRDLRTAVAVFGATPLEFASNWSLTAIPMFVLMGAVAQRAGLTTSLFDAGRMWLSRLPGGLALSTVFASTLFSAASGSSVATTAAMGRIAIPEMLRHRYDAGLAAGSVAAAGTLASTIPPSIAFVLFGWYTQTPVGALLMAGIIPGIITALTFGGFIVAYATLRPAVAPLPTEKVTWAERRRALVEIWPMPLLIASVAGVIYGGLGTATEAAALGALAAIVIAALRGGLTRALLWQCARETAGTVATLLIIAVAAVVFVRFLAMAGVPSAIEQFGRALDPHPLSIIFFTCVVLLILGMFLDPLGIMLITIPVLLPLWRLAGMDLIWVGVLFVKMTEIGLLTPPVGLNAFVVRSVSGSTLPLGLIFRGLVPFVLLDLALVVLIVYFPRIATHLPSTMQ